MNEYKKGNRGNYYLKDILNKLGPEYCSDEESILSSQLKKYKIKHICGNITELSYKDVLENKKCSKCFHRGIHVNYYRDLVKNSYNGEFEYISHEVRGTETFLFIKHVDCLDSINKGFWYSLTFFKKKRPECPFCESMLTVESAQKKLDSLYPNEYIILNNQKILMNKPILIFHIPCKNVISTRLNNIFNMKQTQHGCKYCGMKKAGDTKKKKAEAAFYKKLYEKFNDRFILYSEYNGYPTKIDGYDTLTDKYFSLKPSDILAKSLIPHRSKGELAIKDFLKKSNIEFLEEYAFDDLKDKARLRFDFYIPSLNLLIEYDGEQHFKKRRDDIDGKKLSIVQLHDEMKNKYCEEHNISLLRIKYTKFKKINEILTCRVLNSEN